MPGLRLSDLIPQILEILPIIAFCIANSNQARVRGKDPNDAVFYTIGFWVVGKLVGAIIGVLIMTYIIELTLPVIVSVSALCGAIGFGFISNVIANRGDVLPAPSGNLDHKESEALRKSEVMENPCLITITDSDVDEAESYCFYIYLNGSLMGSFQREPNLPVVSSISFQTTSSLNLITFGSKRQVRLPYPASVQAIPGGRIDLFFSQGRIMEELTRRHTG